MKIDKEAIHKIEVEALASQIAELKGEVDYLKAGETELLDILRRKDSLLHDCTNVLCMAITDLTVCATNLASITDEEKAWKGSVEEIVKALNERLEKLNDVIP